MTRDPRPSAIPLVNARRLGPAVLPVWARTLVILCCVIEACLLLADLLGYPVARQAALMLGGFWSMLFWDGPGLYPAQRVAMFISYGLLHANLLHLAMNMISLAAVARELNRMVGAGRMAATYLASQIGGAILFAVMQPQAGPMIGASGAVFGLAGALVGYAGITLRRRRKPMTPLIRAVALILGLNIALTLLMPAIAWEAHLGGAVVGLLMGLGFALSRPAR
ncbi:rhomboid family intramembrane serine protease [Paracoccus sp. (in: a-proteobacteria)]|uniref:rhomboid family intramembrane serine protease n=1 Tax=Paracoccus sp. TaxID=267 RepID=UPI00396CA8D5